MSRPLRASPVRCGPRPAAASFCGLLCGPCRKPSAAGDQEAVAVGCHQQTIVPLAAAPTEERKKGLSLPAQRPDGGRYSPLTKEQQTAAESK
ncbi:hypothetical protein [Thermacetogenium phaeum]|uniref:hypothetical protein n=1 Tax=Thermacetogenium phaeum TaxID=85874 RepID=UPI0011D1AAE1|nr:hypothetical protein [Thermacetogenium phaeum]